jgi:type II secretory pathway pseudopilin PulG
MKRRSGWSIIELLVVIVVLAMLMAILLPPFGLAMKRARLATCMAMEHDIYTGLITYTSSHQRQMPPFAFSDYQGNVALSGQWGGAQQLADPAAFGRQGVQYVNLWALVLEGCVAGKGLTCPEAPRELQQGTAGVFPYTGRASTFCLRFPYSQELFCQSGPLANRGGKLLGIYAQAAGGQDIRTNTYYSTVPLVRTDVTYGQSFPPGTGTIGSGAYDVTGGTMLCDGFWWQDYAATFPSGPGLKAQPARSKWCHGNKFNVLAGCGSARTVTDDGTVAANSVPAGGSLPDDNLNMATYAERVWQFFDAAK